MTENQALNHIRQLSHSQGFYGRLLGALEEVREQNPEAYHEYLGQFKDCKDPVDMALMIEC